MILGLILSKTGLLTEHGSKDMANILLYAVIPCVIIRSYITDFTMEKLYGLLISAVLAVAAFAAVNTPAAMIVLGYYLSCVRILDLLLNPSLYLASFVRLIIIPLLTLLVLCIIPAGHGQIGMITLIAAATPVGTSTAIFAQKFGQDYERAVCMVCLSTLFSIITMPVVMYLAQMWIM